MRYILIISRKANPKTLAELDDAVNYVNTHDPDLRAKIELRYTDYVGHSADLAIELSEQYGDKITIVACGGDGTIHEVANALAFRKTPMICLPFGTGNDFVKTLTSNWKKWDSVHFLMCLDKVKYKPIDLIRIDSYDLMGGHLKNWSGYMNNVASIGLDTEVQFKAKSIVRKKDTPFNRKTAYIKSALASIFGKRAHNFKFKLELENGDVYESSKDRYTLISICNAKYYGDGFCPAPDADLTDGVADVCAIDDVSIFRAVPLLLAYRLGTHKGKRGIHTFRATSGIVTSTDPSFQLMGNFDGEDFFGHRIRFEVHRKALTIGFFPEDGYKDSK